jgi:hypothetical protein
MSSLSDLIQQTLIQTSAGIIGGIGLDQVLFASFPTKSNGFNYHTQAGVILLQLLAGTTWTYSVYEFLRKKNLADRDFDQNIIYFLTFFATQRNLQLRLINFGDYLIQMFSTGFTPLATPAPKVSTSNLGAVSISGPSESNKIDPKSAWTIPNAKI